MTEARNPHPDLASPAGNALELLVQRVHRLEDAVAAIQDTRQLEQRVADRVAERVRANVPSGNPLFSRLVIDAPRHLPAAIPVNPAPHAQIAQRPSPWKQQWLLVDLVAEARAIMYMFFDPRYRLSWGIRTMTFGLLLAIFTSWIWIPGITLMLFPINFIVVKVVDIVLAYFLVKILVREGRRYRATFPDLFPRPPA
jgi:hypothetical protein